MEVINQKSVIVFEPQESRSSHFCYTASAHWPFLVTLFAGQSLLLSEILSSLCFCASIKLLSDSIEFDKNAAKEKQWYVTASISAAIAGAVLLLVKTSTEANYCDFLRN